MSERSLADVIASESLLLGEVVSENPKTCYSIIQRISVPQHLTSKCCVICSVVRTVIPFSSIISRGDAGDC